MKGQDLEVFKKAHALVLRMYEVTRKFPGEEKFGLISQIRRAAYSIPMNIIEGAGRKSKKEFVHFLSICSGSCEEMKYQLLLSKKSGDGACDCVNLSPACPFSQSFTGNRLLATGHLRCQWPV